MSRYSFDVEFTFGTRPTNLVLLENALIQALYDVRLVESEHENVAVLEFRELYSDTLSLAPPEQWERELYEQMKPLFASLLMVTVRNGFTRDTDTVKR